MTLIGENWKARVTFNMEYIIFCTHNDNMSPKKCAHFGSNFLFKAEKPCMHTK